MDSPVVRAHQWPIGTMCTSGCATTLEKSVADLPGILNANANFAAGTLRVDYDPVRVTPDAISAAIKACGFSCDGGFDASQSAPAAMHPQHHDHAHGQATQADIDVTAAKQPHDHSAHRVATASPPHDAHAGMHHGGDLHAAARDMRRRFLVALAVAVPVFLWSPMGLMEPPPTPGGIGRELWLFLLASGAVLYPGWPFFSAAIRSLRRGVLDMSVLVLLSVGTGYGFSIGSTFVSMDRTSWKLRRCC